MDGITVAAFAEVKYTKETMTLPMCLNSPHFFNSLKHFRKIQKGARKWSSKTSFKKKVNRGAWVTQWVKCLHSGHPLRSSESWERAPAESGSVLNMEPAWDSPPFSPPASEVNKS